ncbi:hypothetical protein SAMN04515617_106206 [Collimonas sp. OK242]|uniref:hypothetical protein n=1 Tax=Collimonas sp. OK242 TaxID=1798195 RepID=UPI00089999A1|nr:hypothetical protein [Collimonas sp. OK242]SDX75738.1 hypothetical protein SAMN04515617_106206 [Collimonas sp. OK242]
MKKVLWIIGGLVCLVLLVYALPSTNAVREGFFLTPSPTQTMNSLPRAVEAIDFSFSESEKPDPNKPKEVEAKRLFSLYQKKYIGSGVEGRALLETIDALGLPRTIENFRRVQELLKSKTTNEERITLTEMLSRFHSRDDALGLNSEVLTELKDLMNSGNKGIGRAAALAYSNFGYLPDSLRVLSDVKDAGYLGDEEYYGQLAFLASQAPKDAQSDILNKIKLGGNQYSVDVLTYSIQKPDDLKQFSPETYGTVQAILAEHQPQFSENQNQFGLTDAVAYAAWLQATALLASSGNTANYDKYLLNELNTATTDPRKIISFLISSGDGERWAERVDQFGALRVAQNNIGLYAAQNPANKNIQETVAEAETKFKRNLH